MQHTGTKPNDLTFATVLRHSGNLEALEIGKQVLAQILKISFDTNVSVCNALVRMYAQSGSIDNSRKVFRNASKRDLGTGNSIISGCAQHRHGKEGLHGFEKMQPVGVKLDCITCVSVLPACRHVGLLNEAHDYFNFMTCDYGIEPRAEHYACMVDLFGRVVQLDQVTDFIKQIPVEPTVSLWRTLLGACRIHGNMEMGEFAADRILELELEIAKTYVLLSNIYATTGRWDKAENVRNLMKERGVIKEPGCSWIEI